MTRNRIFSRPADKTIVYAAAFVASAMATSPALAGATTTALSGTLNPSVYGQTVDFTAMVYASAPTGTVTFKDGATTLGTGALSIVGVGATIASGANFSCAVTAAGGAMCWGDNFDGQLGDGTTTNSTVPVPVTGLSSGVIAIAAERETTCALTDAGAVKCWGENHEGQLGNGTTAASSLPVQVTGLSSGVVAIAMGNEHVCALTDAGAVKCWGDGAAGQLGDDTALNRLTPITVPGLASGVASIGAGGNMSCAVTDTGAAMCWGANDFGQIGDGTLASRYVPTAVSGLSSGIARISPGYYHTCALTTAGAVKCWGRNDDGQLGDGTTTDRLTATAVSGLSAGIAAVSAGYQHSCTVSTAGAIKCWGQNTYGELGDGSLTDSSVPVPVSGATTNGALVDTGWHTTCALSSAGSAKCWGQNSSGEIGDGTTTTRLTPVTASGFGTYTSLVPGTASYSTGDLSAGIHPMTAVFAGDSDNAASTSPALSHDVDQGKTKVKKIKLTPKKPKTGKSVRIKVEMEAKTPAVGTPEGKVVIKDGKKKLGKFKLNSKGKASIKVKSLSAGSHTIKAKYQGDDNWKKSDDNKKVTVKGR